MMGKVIVRKINASRQPTMAFCCDCCGEYVRFGWLLSSAERICRTCKDAMLALELHGYFDRPLPEREARRIHVTHQQVHFFDVQLIPVRIATADEATRQHLDQQARQDAADLFGED